MKLKLPPNVIFHHDVRLMVFRPVGVFNEKRIKTVVEFLDKEEARAEKPFNRFTDLSKLDAIDLDFGFVFRVALHRRLSYAKRRPVKSAFFVTSAAATRVVKIHAMVTDLSPIKVSMFDNIDAAAKWLGVTVETLEIDTEDLKRQPTTSS
jgi:hypothetical protein